MEDFFDDNNIEHPSSQEKLLDVKKLEEAMDSNNKELIDSMIVDYKNYIKNQKDKMYIYTTKVHSNEIAFNRYFEDRTKFMDSLKNKEENLFNEFENLKEKGKHQYEGLEKSKKKELSDVTSQLQGQINLLVSKNATLEDSIRAKEPEKERERNLIREKDDLKKKLEELQVDNRETKLQLTYQKENDWVDLKLQREHISKVKKDVDEKKNSVYQKKKDFDIQKHEHMKHLDFLKEERNKIAQHNKIARQNLIKNEDGLLEFQTLTFKQSKKIQELKEEIKVLNEKFPQEIQQYTKQIEFMKFDNENKKSELEGKYNKLSDVLRLKFKESKNLKKTLQLIMDQRCEIEHFVIEAIQEVMGEKEDESVYDHTYANDDLQSIPESQASKKNSSMHSRRMSARSQKNVEKPKNYGGASSRINTMKNQRTIKNKTKFTWSEREQILKIVFNKLNIGEIPIYWREIDITDLKKEILGEKNKSQINNEKDKSQISSKQGKSQTSSKLEEADQYDDSKLMDSGDLNMKLDDGIRINQIDDKMYNTDFY